MPQEVRLEDLTFWVESRALTEEGVRSTDDEKHRHFRKYHLPQSYLPGEVCDKAANIFIASDLRDVVYSLYNHHRQYKRYIDRIINVGVFEGPAFVEFEKERLSEVEYFRR